MTKYIVKATDKRTGEDVYFRDSFLRTYEEAKSFAKHIKYTCSEYYENVIFEIDEYKLVSSK